MGRYLNVINTNSKMFEVMDVVNLNLERFESVEGRIHIIATIETSNNSLSLVGDAPPPPPHFLMDSIESLKVKTMEGKIVRACSLARNTSEV